jgi:hypothetical protein
VEWLKFLLLLPVPLAAAPSLALSLQLDLTGLLNPQFTTDSQDNIIVAGMVTDCSRPVVHPISGCGGYWIGKLDPTGTTTLFATYLGDPFVMGQMRGSSLTAVRADGAGNIVLLSAATRNVLPAVNAMQPAVRGDANLHLLKLSADGSTILYATYLGGTGRDFGLSLAVDAAGAAYINVISQSGDFPTAPPNPNNVGVGPNLIAKISADGQRLVYVSPFIPKYEGGSLSVDASGSAQLSTISEIVKFSSDGSSVQHIPLPQWPGAGIPLGFVTGDGGHWVTGTVADNVLPVTANAFEASDMKNPYLRVEQGQVNAAAQPVTGFAMNAFAVDPVERFRIYAATTTGLFKSEDNGWIWDQVYPLGVQSAGVQSVLVDPFDQNTLYIGRSINSGVSGGLLFRSTDRGQTWAPFAQDLLTQFGYYGTALIADPNTRGKLYAVGGPFFHSEDGGQTWGGGWNGGWGAPLPPQITDGSGQLSNKAVAAVVDGSVAGRVYVLSDQSCIGFCGDHYTLSRSDDGGVTWSFLNYSFTPLVDPSTGDVFAANLPKGQITVFRAGNFGAPELLDSPGNVISMAFDPENPGTVYVSLDTGGIFRSSDGGRSFQYVATLPTPGAIAIGDGGVIHATQNAHVNDGFGFKFDASGNIVYGTYFGGGQTLVKAAAVAPNGHLFIAGSTGPGLPLANAIQPEIGGGTDGFLAELDSSGTLVSSTYLGGPDNDEIDSITVLADGSVFAVGTVVSPIVNQGPYVQKTILWRVAP